MSGLAHMSELQQREAVVAEARSWIRTPYHHHARIKGAGVDCAMLPVAVYSACGLMPPDQDFGAYPTQWHLHHDEEVYLGIVLSYAREIGGPPQPGDFTLWRFGRAFSHGGIVTAWPRVVHSYIGRGVYEEDTAIGADFLLKDGSPRLRRFFTLWGER
jgi:cell wall-associated NlpC family hydrolase